MRGRPLAALAAGILFASTLQSALAQQQYPAKPLRIVIPYPPGGGTDVTARMLAPHLTERWGRPVIVDSRPGGSAMIGTDIVAKSAPDGYTILLSVSAEMAATEVVGSTPDELARFQLAEIEKYKKIAQAAGIKAE